MQDPVAQVYARLTEQGIEEARNHSKPPRRFRASEASACVRQLWYRLDGQRPAPRDSRGFMYGVCGDADHDITRQLMDWSGVKVGGITHNADGSIDEDMQVRRVIEHTDGAGETRAVEISCRPDGTLDEETLLEIKGTGFYPYEWLNKEFDKGGLSAVLARIKEKHKSWYQQMQVTMRLTGYQKTYLLVKDRSSGTLGFENSTGKRAGIVIDYDDEAFQTTLKRFAFVLRKLDEGVPPTPEFAPGSYDCKFCPFRYACHDAEARRKKGLTPAIVYPGPQIEEYQ